jgi:hypothetical protein
VGRRTFEKKTRAQNQRELLVQRDKFTGQYSDIPANELAVEASRQLINCVPNVDYIEPREGLQQILAETLPDAPFTSYTSSKSASVVTLTGYSTTSKDVGKLIIYANGALPDTIVSVASGTSYNVADGHAVAASTAIVHYKINGFYYHKHDQIYILHYGPYLYWGTLAFSWTKIYQTGLYGITDNNSQISEIGDNAIVFCSGMWKIDLSHNQYWQCNVQPSNNTLINQTSPSAGYFRRYVNTMTRMTGTTPLYTDRQSLKIQQETGSNLLNSNGIDYVDIYTFQKPVGNLQATYQELVTGAAPVLANIVGSNLFFNISINGVAYTIEYSVAATASYYDVATAIQTNMQSLISPNCKCSWALNKFVMTQIDANVTVSYLSSPTPVYGWTDVSSALEGTLAAGATFITVPYYAQAQLQYYTANIAWKAFTHYSWYCSRQLQNDNNVITGNPSALAWLMDVPIMKALQVSSSGLILTPTIGKFTASDYGTYLTLISGGRGFQVKITAINPDGTATVDSGPCPPLVSAYAFIGASYGFHGSITNGVVSVTDWWSTWDNNIGYTPSLTAQTVSVGDPMFAADGNVYYVTSVASNTSFTLDNLSLNHADWNFATAPKQGYAQGVSSYPNAVIDSTDDAVISSRIGTLGLLSRFYTAMPNASLGIVIPGFVIVAYQNQYGWNNISINQQFIVGNNNPNQQITSISDQITAISANQNMLTICCVNSTYTAQTNLGLSVTDANTGNVVYTLPDAVLVDMYNGVANKNLVCQFERDMTVVVNNDFGVRTWNGLQYSNNLILNQIQNLLKAAACIMIGYDEKYGITIFTGATMLAYDTMYVIGLREDKSIGCAGFNLLPFPHLGVQPVNNGSGRSFFVSLNNILTGVVTRFKDGLATTWLPNSPIDVPDSTAPQFGFDIPSSITTGDDVAKDQAQKLRHLENHAYISGRFTNENPTSSIVINVTIYNDVGNSVTVSKQIGTAPLYEADVNFDARIEGHRLRYQYSFSTAYYILNGLSAYYVAYDKAMPIANRQGTEATYQTNLGSPISWLTRSELPINAAVGKLLQQFGAVSRITGPDGRYGAYNTTGAFTGGVGYQAPDTASPNYLIDSYVGNSGASWATSFWIKNTNVPQCVLWCSSCSIIISAANTLQIAYDNNHYHQWTLNATTGWTNIWVTVSVGFVSVYQDGILLGTTTITSLAILGPIVLMQGGCNLGFLRIFNFTIDIPSLTYANGDVLVGADKTEPA